MSTLAHVRVCADSAALGTVAARHYEGAALADYARHFDAVLQQRQHVADGIVAARARWPRPNRMQTRINFHALQTLDASIREHIDTVCGRPTCDCTRERAARAFEMRQLLALNEACAHGRLPSDEFALAQLAHSPALPAAPDAAVPIFVTAAARSLHAAVLLQSLPVHALAIAPAHNFSYVSRTTAPLCVAGPLSAAGDASAYRFLAEKIATDERHEIIPASLSKHISTVMLASQSPAHSGSAALAAQVRQIAGIFDSDIQPLVLSAAGALPGAPPDTPFAFLHSSAVRTGYDKRATRKLMMHVLGFDTPVACAS